MQKLKNFIFIPKNLPKNKYLKLRTIEKTREERKKVKIFELGGLK